MISSNLVIGTWWETWFLQTAFRSYRRQVTSSPFTSHNSSTSIARCTHRAQGKESYQTRRSDDNCSSGGSTGYELPFSRGSPRILQQCHTTCSWSFSEANWWLNVQPVETMPDIYPRRSSSEPKVWRLYSSSTRLAWAATNRVIIHTLYFYNLQLLTTVLALRLLLVLCQIVLGTSSIAILISYWFF